MEPELQRFGRILNKQNTLSPSFNHSFAAFKTGKKQQKMM